MLLRADFLGHRTRQDVPGRGALVPAVEAMAWRATVTLRVAAARVAVAGSGRACSKTWREPCGSHAAGATRVGSIYSRGRLPRLDLYMVSSGAADDRSSPVFSPRSGAEAELWAMATTPELCAARALLLGRYAFGRRITVELPARMIHLWSDPPSHERGCGGGRRPGCGRSSPCKRRFELR